MSKHAREPRFLYNLKGIIRHVTPRIFPQMMLDSKVKNIFKTYDIEILAKRLNFYNKLKNHFEIPMNDTKIPNDCLFNDMYDDILPQQPSRLSNLRILKPVLATLGENSLKHGSVYYYDSYEHSRYFDDNLRWCFLFHDVDSLVSFPAIVKSRPIIAHNENSVLMQLEKHRHFHFIKDSIKYEDKKDILLFRGAVYQGHRMSFFSKHFENPLCDIGHVGRSESYNARFEKPAMSIESQLHYKFLLSLEGYDVASNLKWVLSSNSLCVMPRPQIETWFMESKLIAGEHYAEIKLDYSDLDSVLEYFLSNPNRAKEIIANANAYCAQFYNKGLESALNILVLRKYFYLSNQIDVTPQEKEIFESKI